MSRGGGRVTVQCPRVKVAQRWVLDDTVFHAVELVTLAQDFVVDPGLPCGYWDEIRACAWTCDGEEAGAPGVEVVEIDAWGAGEDAVKVMRKELCRFYALAAAEGTAYVVGFVMAALVEVGDEGFTCFHACVETVWFD